MLKWVGGFCIFALLFFGLGTYLALELDEVLSVATVNHRTGEARHTHVWFIRNRQELILEAGHPNNPWVQDIAQQAIVQLSGETIQGQHELHIKQDTANHDKVRSLMREKYGWRDIWVTALFDTSNSKLIVAEPIK